MRQSVTLVARRLILGRSPDVRRLVAARILQRHITTAPVVEYGQHIVDRHVERRGKLFDLRATPSPSLDPRPGLVQPALSAQKGTGLREANDAAVLLHVALHVVTNPPARVSREAVTAIGIEALCGLEEADDPFAPQVLHRDAGSGERARHVAHHAGLRENEPVEGSRVIVVAVGAGKVAFIFGREGKRLRGHVRQDRATLGPCLKPQLFGSF